VEVDTGLRRLGRPAGEPTAALVRELVRIDGIEVVGLLTHAGHAYRAASAAALRAAALAEGEDLVRTAELLAADGIALREISVGSTPTARDVAGVAGVTEIRPGTYVFNDVQQLRLGVSAEADCAVRVLTTVVAVHDDGRFVVDSGTKSLTADGATDAPTYPGRGWIVDRPELRLERCSEEHGVGAWTGSPPSIGERLQVVPVHVCPVVDLFDEAVGVRGGDAIETIAIAARGRSR
jgi:D-serine deaminase-like pyridoxal phosphate-dependent protein